MTLTNARIETSRSESPFRFRWSFHGYAIISALLGLDLILFGGWIADRAISSQVLATTMDFGLYARALGVGCVAFGGLIIISAGRGTQWAAFAPVMAGTAGAVSVMGALAGLSVLTGFGIGLLLAAASLDFLFMVLMRRALAG